MKNSSTLLLRWATAIILLAHSIPSLLSGGVNDFGELYLNAVGFAPLGVPLAWAIKLSHAGAAICFIFNKYLKWAGIITMGILVAGIVMLHFKEGWYVVGPGRNGMEFNFLLIVVILSILFPNGWKS
ncbi:hypothetical protein QWY31_10180 [Cytophagales bacterium LB-30]|uniref:DoxX family protein n=1 Tax=Shiella aurantiaca TaxID=3058365 RepID=A0ABT8F6E2_9BACT|nr:hypothetical protein [Shiella aurantiaca]MDN4165873.1 hypothetical protein [Shiella aurantiaca]